jgi:hypothetical protein
LARRWLESLSLNQPTRRTWSLEESHRFLTTLAQSVYEHEALNNAFFTT